MLDKNTPISRRDFIKNSILSLGSVMILPKLQAYQYLLQNFPEGEYLARNTVYLPNTVPLRTKPNIESALIRNLNEDECLVWLREVVGAAPLGSYHRKWVETPEGYVYLPRVQKVQNKPNQPITSLPQVGEEKGCWMEVTVPYVILQLVNPPARAPWLQEASPNLWRLYYSQVVWVDDISINDEGIVFYRVNEKFGYGDIFWAEASAFRQVQPEEITPIHPDVQDKQIIVNVNHQTLSCYEDNKEVYFCRVSTGLVTDDLKLITPPGEFWIWRKMVSTHMSGGGTGAGWDTMGIPWTCLFIGEGIAVHSTFWHNDFGAKRSHGCVNAQPDDAKWIFRWTKPYIDYYPGDLTDNTFTSTKIKVIEPLY